MKPILKIRGLTKSFEEIPVIHNLSLDVFEDEILCIMGASGVGKSTLLNCIAGITPFESGEIYCDPVLYENVKVPFPFVFQEMDTLLPWKTVRQNVILVTDHMLNDEIDALLDRVDLLKHAHKYPRELSGGMKQRVGIARALACRSKVLLMDEPFGSLDLEMRVKLQDLLMSIQKKFKLSVVFVTHDLNEAERIGNRIIKLA